MKEPWESKVFTEEEVMKAKIYYGAAIEGDRDRIIFATVTGEMADGTLVYTEVEQREDGSAVFENGEPKLILDNQFTRRTRHGMQTFHRL